MVTSDMLLRLITDLQRDVTARQGRRTLLEYVCVSSGARLALLFVYDRARQLLSLLDRWGRRSNSFPATSAQKQRRLQGSKRIPASGLFGSVLGQREMLQILNASADSRILPVERYWIGRYDRLVLGAVGEQQGVLVLCFDPGHIPLPGADPQSIPGESNLRISLALLSAYLSDESAPAGRVDAARSAAKVGDAPAHAPIEALQQLSPSIEQLAQSYERRLQVAIDEERERIAQNIHDTVAQQMADVLYKLEFILRIVDKNAEAARREIARVSDILKESLHELRYNISALIPLELEEQGFEIALRTVLDEFKRNDPEVKIEYEGEAVTLIPPLLEVPIFRFIQEALHNVHKHANASRVTIRIRVLAGLLLVEVSDNGQGFDIAEVMNMQAAGSGYHIGLRSMRNRIHQAEGSWEIQSKPGAGTSVKARFHLATHPAALTNREREVLRLMAEGLTNRAIAERLSVSTETVKSHVHHIMQKMHVNDRTQAAVIAARQQWL